MISHYFILYYCYKANLNETIGDYWSLSFDLSWLSYSTIDIINVLGSNWFKRNSTKVFENQSTYFPLMKHWQTSAHLAEFIKSIAIFRSSRFLNFVKSWLKRHSNIDNGRKTSSPIRWIQTFPILLLSSLCRRGNWFSFQRVILFTSASRIRKAGGLITMSVREWDGKKGEGRPFDTKWILEKVFVSRAGGCVCSRAMCLVFPILFCPPSNTQCAGCRLIARPTPATTSQDLFVHIRSAVTKRSLLFRSSESGV